MVIVDLDGANEDMEFEEVEETIEELLDGHGYPVNKSGLIMAITPELVLRVCFCE